MKSERVELLKKVASGEITPEQANDMLVALFKYRISLFSDNIENGKSHWVNNYEGASNESQHEMEGYQWALNDMLGFLDEDNCSGSLVMATYKFPNGMISTFGHK